MEFDSIMTESRSKSGSEVRCLEARGEHREHAASRRDHRVHLHQQVQLYRVHLDVIWT